MAREAGRIVRVALPLTVLLIFALILYRAGSTASQGFDMRSFAFRVRPSVSVFSRLIANATLGVRCFPMAALGDLKLPQFENIFAINLPRQSST